jgi:hypothetical protein
MALAMRISDDDVNAERSIVMEEWRKGQTAQGRAMEAYWKMLFAGSQYPHRFPIGTVEVRTAYTQHTHSIHIPQHTTAYHSTPQHTTAHHSTAHSNK